jgi:hypothetical protein
VFEKKTSFKDKLDVLSSPAIRPTPDRGRKTIVSVNSIMDKNPSGGNDGTDDEAAHNTAVVTAIRKAGRRLSHVDPMMGSHAVSHGHGKNSPLVVKHTAVMRPSVKSPAQKGMNAAQLSSARSFSNLVLKIDERDIERELGTYATVGSGKMSKKGEEGKDRCDCSEKTVALCCFTDYLIPCTIIKTSLTCNNMKSTLNRDMSC